MEKLLQLATPSLWCVPEVSFASSLNNICLVALRFTMQYSCVIFFASRDIVVRAGLPSQDKCIVLANVKGVAVYMAAENTC